VFRRGKFIIVSDKYILSRKLSPHSSSGEGPTALPPPPCVRKHSDSYTHTLSLCVCACMCAG